MLIQLARWGRGDELISFATSEELWLAVCLHPHREALVGGHEDRLDGRKWPPEPPSLGSGGDATALGRTARVHATRVPSFKWHSRGKYRPRRARLSEEIRGTRNAEGRVLFEEPGLQVHARIMRENPSVGPLIVVAQTRRLRRAGAHHRLACVGRAVTFGTRRELDGEDAEHVACLDSSHPPWAR